MEDLVLTTAASTGAASAIAAPSSGISDIGFGSGGVIAGSWAASMTSAAAIQFTGAGRSGGRRFAGNAPPPSAGNWTIGTEEGIGNVKLYVFSNEKEALKSFNDFWVARILYNHEGQEVTCAGLNRWAIDTVRRVIGEYTNSEKQAIDRGDCGPLAGCIVAFKTRHGHYLSAHPNGELCVENNPLDWETFRLYGINGHHNNYAAKSVSHDQRFIQMADGFWGVRGLELGDNQVLTFEKSEQDENIIFIRSSLNGKYVSVTNDQRVVATESPSSSSEHFEILIL